MKNKFYMALEYYILRQNIAVINFYFSRLLYQIAFPAAPVIYSYFNVCENVLAPIYGKSMNTTNFIHFF